MQDLIATVLHPGDLGFGGLLMLLLLFGLLIVGPILVVGFIIYKVASRK